MTRRRLSGPVAALVTLAVLGGSGVAVAGWNANAALSATASAAAPATTIAQSGSLATTYQYTGSSSAAVAGSLAIKNTGGTPLSYSLATDLTGSTVLAAKTTLSLWIGNCTGTVPANAVKTTLANPAPTLPTAASTLAPNATVTVCVATRIEGRDASSTNAALQGQSVTAAFRVTGAVGTSWTATATTEAISQSVYQLAAAGTPVCTATGLLPRIKLSWSAPANPPTRSNITYEVVNTASSEVISGLTFTTSGGTTSTQIEGKHLPNVDGTYTLAVRARESAYGTTSLLTTPVSVTRDSIWPGVISWTNCS